MTTIIERGKNDPRFLKRARAALKEESSLFGDVLESLPRDRWPAAGPACGMVAAWRSRRFCVQVFDIGGGAFRLSICRAELNSQGDWKDGISWDELQRLKREAGFGDREAIEIYPADADVVNVANMRHLVVVPEPLPWTWRAEK